MEVLMKRILVVLLMLLGLQVDIFAAGGNLKRGRGGHTLYDEDEETLVARQEAADRAEAAALRAAARLSRDTAASSSYAGGTLIDPALAGPAGAGAGAGDAEVEAEIRDLQRPNNRRRISALRHFPGEEDALNQAAILAACEEMEDANDLFGDNSADQTSEYFAAMIPANAAGDSLPGAHEVGGGALIDPALAGPKGATAPAPAPDVKAAASEVGGGSATGAAVGNKPLSCPRRVDALKNIVSSGFLTAKELKTLHATARSFSTRSLKLTPAGFNECMAQGPHRFGQFLAKHPNLEELDLSGCRGGAEALAALPADTIPHLRSLNLSNTNPRKDVFKDIMARWPELERLDLSSCSKNVVAGVVSTLKARPEGTNLLLKSLELGSNLNDRALALIIQYCPDIERLILTHSSATPQCLAAELAKMAAAGKISKIYNLHLSRVGAELTAIIHNCPDLKILNFSYCVGAAALLDAALAELPKSKISKIAELNLWNNEAMPPLTSIIARCPDLRTLDLWACRGAAETLEAALAALPVGRNSNIEILNLYVTGVTPSLTSIIARCPHLRELNLASCEGAVGALAAALTALPVGTIRNIEELDLSMTGVVTPADLTTIVARCPNLKKLNLASCEGAITALMVALTASGINSNIEELNLFNTEPTPNIDVIIARCPDLRTLNLGYCLGAAEALGAALTALPVGTRINIQKLDLHNTDPAPNMTTIIARCPHLRDLDLHGCLGSAESLKAALEGLPADTRPKIVALNLSNTQTSTKNKTTIRALLPQLETFYSSN
jgi:Leucine-rich repeat (LRR) protein